MKKVFLIIGVLFSLTGYSQKEYKVGVVLFRTASMDNSIVLSKTLDSIVAAITANSPQRTNAAGDKVKLVIQLEVPWSSTDLSTSSSPNDKSYNFDWYKGFAAMCQQKGIKWTPLLSPHYIPDYVKLTYSNDLMSKYSDETNTFDPDKIFLKYCPSSQIWRNEISDWIRKFIEEMYNGSVQNGYFNVNDNTENKAIDEILIGNEMIYPFNVAGPVDRTTKEKWIERRGSITTGSLEAYPANKSEFINLVNNPNSTFSKFRNSELAYCIAHMLYVAKLKLASCYANTTPAPNTNKIGISSKFFSYFFPRSSTDYPTIYKETQVVSDKMCGYDDPNIGYLLNQSNKFIAIDSYPTSMLDPVASDTVSWHVDYDFIITDRKVAFSNSISSNKKYIYLSEFNKNPSHNNTPLTTTQIFSKMNLGFNNYNLRYVTFFAWNPSQTAAEPYKITEGQQLGLYNLFNSIATRVPQSFNNAATALNFEEEPIDYYNFSSNAPVPPYTINKNNFASGAYTITNPLPYSNITSLTISKNDIDWFKFTRNGKVYYIKVVQQSNIEEPDYLKQYGLKLEIPCSNVLSAYTTNATLATGVYGVQVDTKIFLYNADLVELASNDDYNGIKTFSKIYYNLDDAPLASSYVVNARQSNSETTDVSAYNMKSEIINSETFDVLVSPNPAVNYLDVSVTGYSKNYNVLLIDLNGKTVYQEENVPESKKTIDVSSINEGMYCLIVTSDNDKKVKKIIKLAK